MRAVLRSGRGPSTWVSCWCVTRSSSRARKLSSWAAVSPRNMHRIVGKSGRVPCGEGRALSKLASPKMLLFAIHPAETPKRKTSVNLLCGQGTRFSASMRCRRGRLLTSRTTTPTSSRRFWPMTLFDSNRPPTLLDSNHRPCRVPGKTSSWCKPCPVCSRGVGLLISRAANHIPRAVLPPPPPLGMRAYAEHG